jgi:glycosyltransferase involved in cell wall biosynthesis
VPRRDEIRAGFGIGRRDFAVLFLARFLPRKRPFDLLEVVRELRDEGIVDTFLLMVGEGESRKEMEMFAARHGLRVLFTGFKNQTEIPPYYAAADAYMMLSDFDPSPKAMNEAMNFSLPIICTRETGTAMDLIEDGGNGFLIDAGDRVALKRHLVRLAGNRALSRRMGARSAAIVAGWNFTADAKGFKEAVSHVWNG